MRDLHWHHVRFVLFNGGDDDRDYRIVHGDSVLHYMLAVEVCEYLVAKYQDQIQSWRFHRMQIRVKEGSVYPQHHFKLKLYCSSEFFRHIVMGYMKKHPVLKELKKENLLLRTEMVRSDSYDIKDDYDEKWPMEIKESWPLFICGVSSMWLLMVTGLYAKELVLQKIPDPSELDVWKRFDIYKAVSDKLEDIWRDWAYHSVIHHANAVFGYKWVHMYVPPERMVVSFIPTSKWIRWLQKLRIIKKEIVVDDAVIKSWTLLSLKL
ncbi:MAG: hypothetical protein ACXABV_16825 [Candidatus Thorarchaeota archaeon]